MSTPKAKTYEKPRLRGLARLTGHQREGDRWSWGLHVYNRNEKGGPWWSTAQWMLHPVVSGYYLGVLAKGWWTLGPKQTSNYGEVGVALGGEDNMAQVDLQVPWVFRFAVGVRVPRKLIRPVVYERRTLSIRPGYIGHLAWVDVLYDETAGSMRDYYAREERESTPSRAALWPGWQFRVDVKLRDRLLGPMVYESRDILYEVEPRQPVRHLKVPSGGMVVGIPTVVAMPEGTYPAVVGFTEDTWRRSRLPWNSRVLRRARVEMLVPIPVPGKGENSWDIDDDAIFSQTAPGTSVAAATAGVAKSAMHTRERYAKRDWRPANGWPVGVGRR